MTTYNNLPVYKASYDFLFQTFELIKLFDKQYKYTLGDKIKNEIMRNYDFWEKEKLQIGSVFSIKN